jgi:hypothetical protein
MSLDTSVNYVSGLNRAAYRLFVVPRGSLENEVPCLFHVGRLHTENAIDDCEKATLFTTPKLRNDGLNRRHVVGFDDDDFVICADATAEDVRHEFGVVSQLISMRSQYPLTLRTIGAVVPLLRPLSQYDCHLFLWHKATFHASRLITTM